MGVARLVVLAMSLWWTGNGIVAFMINASFSVQPMHSCTVFMLGIPITVNGWHALFHLLTGLAGLLVVFLRRSAVTYAVFSGIFYLSVAALGFVGGSSVLGAMAVDTVGNWVHSVEGMIMLGTGLLARVISGRTRITRVS